MNSGWVSTVRSRLAGKDWEHVLRPRLYPQPVNEMVGNVGSYSVGSALREAVVPEAMNFFLQSPHFFTKLADVLLELFYVLPHFLHLFLFLPYLLRTKRSAGEKQSGTDYGDFPSGYLYSHIIVWFVFSERKLQMELLNKLCHMIAVHQPMMAGYGNGHHQSFSITEVLSGGDFGNTVARTHIGGVLHVGE